MYEKYKDIELKRDLNFYYLNDFLVLALTNFFKNFNYKGWFKI